jgi:hypothetical protein
MKDRRLFHLIHEEFMEVLRVHVEQVHVLKPPHFGKLFVVMHHDVPRV